MKERSPHQLLAKLSQHKRDKEAATLEQLTHYQAKLIQIIKQSSLQLKVLQGQRDIQIDRGTEAVELLMLEQSISEHQQHISSVSCELTTLDVAIKQQKIKWTKEHKKMKAHEKLQEQLQHQWELKRNQKNQRALDDQFSSKMLQQQRVAS